MNFTQAHLSAVVAFTMWGTFPLYWKIFSGEASWDLFGQRLIWSFITLLLIIAYQKKFKTLGKIWKDKKVRYMLILSGIMISSNWLIYIYAVSVGRVLEASLGYFLNTLINVFMGWLILKETIRPTQWPAIILALLAIILIAVRVDFAHFPWIAISLSLTFALYGLIRKVTAVGSIEGLTFETSFVLIPVLIFWANYSSTPLTIYEHLPLWKSLVLVLSGLVTCIPLVLFAYSARNLRLQTLGFIQYLSPSFKFLCGWLVFKETISSELFQTFVMIWVALIWYSIESIVVKKWRRFQPS